MVFFAEYYIWIKELRQEKQIWCKNDRRTSQQVADIVRLEKMVALWQSHVSIVPNSGHMMFSGDFAKLAIQILQTLIDFTEIVWIVRNLTLFAGVMKMHTGGYFFPDTVSIHQSAVKWLVIPSAEMPPDYTCVRKLCSFIMEFTYFTHVNKWAKRRYMENTLLYFLLATDKVFVKVHWCC